jgi:Gram-negative bacterial TonB protein C-terminal
MSLLTSSPTASVSEPRLEEFPLEPGEAEAPPLNPAPTIKTNMVAHEIRVTATGAPPDKSTGERELFTEETSSVLVFENGGVIRLSAAVAPGQLLLLTNVESKREIVAQVKRKRAYRPTSCYVELEFAEPAPRFWGMEFSAAAALLPKDTQDAQAAERVISAEATADDPGEPPPAPTVEEVQAFKREVEALRGQPKLMQTPATSQQAPAAVPTLAPEPSPTLAAEDVPSAESMASSGSDEASGSAFAEKSLPIENNPVATQLTAEEQALLPKPSLDFSRSLPKAKRSLRARGSFTPNFRGGVLRLALLTTALVLTAAGGASYKHWIPWKSATKKPVVSSPTTGVDAKTSLLPGSQTTAQAHPEFRDTKVASDAPVTSAGRPTQSAAVPDRVPPEPTDAVETGAQPFASSSSAAQPAVKRQSPATSAAENRPTVRPTARAASDSVAPSAVGGVFVPPKLIKSVRAVASLDALWDFETGNVVIDAVVGSAGEVNFISVLAGPPSLRAAAVESLKQYQYQPATRNGQPVPAHVTITIHFRFEP